jgi:hypothetical protein
MRIVSESMAVAIATMLLGGAQALAADVPVISTRNYTGGNAIVRVTGSFRFETVIPINSKASISDGEMTWLQYGDSGAESPNALVTVSTQEVGLAIARGKEIATIGAEECTGSMDVTTARVSGNYRCKGVTSYDPRSGAMGKVDIDIQFTGT